MEFTWEAFRNLIVLLRKHGYEFSNYHNCKTKKKCVIFRHDIDTSIEHALTMARLEAECNVQSTYFVLLSSDFYNVFSQKSREQLMEIQKMGHEIGLHFDETCYSAIGGDSEKIQEKIIWEAGILEQAVRGGGITAVSMHRPSKEILDADLCIPGMVNSYAKQFFGDFKYLSDSRRRWREPVLEIVESERYTKLHILTHAFWYHDFDQSLYKTLTDFIALGNQDRCQILRENITDLDTILGIKTDV